MQTKLLPILALACLLPACTMRLRQDAPTVLPGPPGPAGPAGVPGPAGPPGAPGALLARPVILTDNDAATLVLADPTNVVISLRLERVSVRLPPAGAVAGRLVTARAAGRGDIRLMAANGDTIEDGPAFMVATGEMVTLMADGGQRWFVISTSDLD